MPCVTKLPKDDTYGGVVSVKFTREEALLFMTLITQNPMLGWNATTECMIDFGCPERRKGLWERRQSGT